MTMNRRMEKVKIAVFTQRLVIDYGFQIEYNGSQAPIRTGDLVKTKEGKVMNASSSFHWDDNKLIFLVFATIVLVMLMSISWTYRFRVTDFSQIDGGEETGR